MTTTLIVIWVILLPNGLITKTTSETIVPTAKVCLALQDKLIQKPNTATSKLLSVTCDTLGTI
jgi:hypothetical protein